MTLHKVCALALFVTAAACGSSSSSNGGNTASGTVLDVTFNPITAYSYGNGSSSSEGNSPSVLMSNSTYDDCTAGDNDAGIPSNRETLHFSWNITSGLLPTGSYAVGTQGVLGVDALFEVADDVQANADAESGTVTVTSSSASLIEGTYSLTFENSNNLTTTLTGSFSAPNCATP